MKSLFIGDEDVNFLLHHEAEADDQSSWCLAEVTYNFGGKRYRNVLRPVTKYKDKTYLYLPHTDYLIPVEVHKAMPLGRCGR